MLYISRMNKNYLNKLSKNLIESCILNFLKEKDKEYEIKLNQISHSERIKAYYINYARNYTDKNVTTEILLSYYILKSKIHITISVDYSIKNIDLVYWLFSNLFRRLSKRINIEWGGQDHIEAVVISKNFENRPDLIQAFKYSPNTLSLATT